ncbi:MAG: beta-ketoacyl-ACP synthase III [Candidatus Hydrogenedentota bacterium]
MFLPERVVTNDDVSEMCDTNDEWIRKRTGIHQRHFAEEGIGAADLGTEAAKIALENAGMDAEELDLIICPTVTPDHMAPGSALIMQANLGAKNAAGFDINAACSGFVYGLATANAYIQTGMAKNILLVGAETISRVLNWDYRETAVLFGDGAGAVVLTADDTGHGVLTSHIGADGTGAYILNMPQGGFKYTPSWEYMRDNPPIIGMNGQELFKRAVKTFESEIRLTLENAGVSVDEIALFVPHQANGRIIDAACQRVGLPSEKAYINIDHTGNTVAASIPMALHEAWTEGRIKEGDLVLFAAFGAGLTWASALVRW